MDVMDDAPSPRAGCRSLPACHVCGLNPLSAWRDVPPAGFGSLGSQDAGVAGVGSAWAAVLAACLCS